MALERLQLTFEEQINNRSFEMFSEAGNRACRSAVKSIYKKINGKTRMSKKEIIEFVRSKIKKISETHSEVWDTEPHEHIMYFVKLACKDANYDTDLNRYDF